MKLSFKKLLSLLSKENTTAENDNSVDVMLGEEKIEVVKTTKESKKTSDVPKFLDGFDIDTYSVVDKKISDSIKKSNLEKYGPSQHSITKRNELCNEEKRSLLKKSILIMLDYEQPERKDLDFIGKSRINGKPIYRYIGKQFENFDLKYEEVFYNPYVGIQ